MSDARLLAEWFPEFAEHLDKIDETYKEMRTSIRADFRSPFDAFRPSAAYIKRHHPLHYDKGRFRRQTCRAFDPINRFQSI